MNLFQFGVLGKIKLYLARSSIVPSRRRYSTLIAFVFGIIENKEVLVAKQDHLARSLQTHPLEREGEALAADNDRAKLCAFFLLFNHRLRCNLGRRFTIATPAIVLAL